MAPDTILLRSVIIAIDTVGKVGALLSRVKQLPSWL